MSDPAIVFGAASSFGAISGWSEQNSSVAVLKDRASALDNVGTEAISKLINERTEVSTSYKAQVTGSAPDMVEEIGDLVNSLIVTSISLQTSGSDFATMTLAGHNHAANPHASSPALRKGEHGITLTDGFGSRDFLGGTVGSVATLASSSCTITCDHTDELSNSGGHFVGQNSHGMIEAECVYIGVPSVSVGAGWDNTASTTDTDAQGFKRTTVKATKKVALA